MPSRHFTPRLMLSMAAVMALTACSPASAPATQGDPAATSPDTQAAEEMTRLNDSRDAFLARCLKNAIPSDNGVPATSESCAVAYRKAQQSLDAARLLIAAHAPDGAAKATSLDGLKTRLSGINWTNEQVGGSTLASGRVEPFDAVITQRNQQQHLAFNWSGPAGDVPVDVPYALLLDGAQLTLIACNSASPDEIGRVWHVTGTDSDPFDLVTYSRVGPSGTALSSYSASTPLDNNRLTLESLSQQDSDWAVCG